ncbi:Thyroid hormone-induced protein B like protein [Argiope bruennichi]|uniref:Thyroid hormone-induced protein B like protein n=2 Tax=Argiope bruennichi TaxID=94029 RepID=A0A8T0FEV6_ARGBR|nr:Thyroid hormone-induced protein B like protein [Argiope bruennichi]
MFIVLGIFSLTATLIVAEQSYSCDFERDTCGFTNEEGKLSNWERVETELGGRKGSYMQVLINSTEKHIARMITPYFEHHEEAPGCLVFDYYASGDGVKGFTVEQEHDYGISTIWLRSGNKSGWQKAQVDVEIDENTRFFFTAKFDPSIDAESTVAVDNVVLRISKC